MPMTQPATESEALEDFRNYLDEVFEPVTVCGYDYDAARALELLDPIAFRWEFLNYCDVEGIDLDELDS